MIKKNIQLLIIDPQNDFCDKDTGSLFVDGADRDIWRISDFIKKFGDNLTNIHVSLDSHQAIHIAHSCFWIDSNGNHPKPFTQISLEDVQNNKWIATKPEYRDKARNYVKALDRNDKYTLCIWPEHCLLGTHGNNIPEILSEELYNWSRNTYIPINFIVKGMNIFTENYSIIKADIVDHQDLSTDINFDLLKKISKADELIIAGEALSHCVAASVVDIVRLLPTNIDIIKKIVILEDCTSNVKTFEHLGEKFVGDMKELGVRFITSKDYLS